MKLMEIMCWEKYKPDVVGASVVDIEVVVSETVVVVSVKSEMGKFRFCFLLKRMLIRWNLDNWRQWFNSFISLAIMHVTYWLRWIAGLPQRRRCSNSLEQLDRRLCSCTPCRDQTHMQLENDNSFIMCFK